MYRPRCASAEHVQVAMQLGLHGIGAEVGDDAKSAGRVGLAEFDSELGGTGKEGRLPELLLAHVGDRRYEVHEGRPVQCVFEDDEFVVLVNDTPGKRTGGDAAECALAGRVRGVRRALMGRAGVRIEHRVGAPVGHVRSGGSPGR